jgi:hypothetical protein
MPISEAPAPSRPVTQGNGIDLTGVLLAIAVGAIGGALAASIGQSSMGRLGAIGAAFGLVFSLALQHKATGAGSGMIWGLGAGYMLWMVLPALAVAIRVAVYPTGAMFGESRTRFPELVGCITCIGAPVGVCLGLWGRFRSQRSGGFHWGRAIVAGGAAGVVAALIFSRWMYEGDFYPLISGFGTLNSHFGSVVFHFSMACLIGSSFGLFFQADVRNLGSAMGWGVAYAMFWWFLAQLTLFPLAAGAQVDWSAEHASQLFGPMVGHILFGLILGIVYSGVDMVWVRLFIDADPLNRKRQGPGVNLLLSLAWGSAAGLAGGLIALPLMIYTGVIARLAGLDTGLPLIIGVCLHLAVSTLIGASYGVLFRGETSNVVFGSLWGLLFGLIWWYAGPLTLLPLMRTGECDWRPEAAAALFPSLVGHLLFGLVTANVFLAFERRYTRWLLADPRYAELEKRRTRPVASPAPALCAFVIGLGVLLPILLS